MRRVAVVVVGALGAAAALAACAANEDPYLPPLADTSADVASEGATDGDVAADSTVDSSIDTSPDTGTDSVAPADTATDGKPSDGGETGPAACTVDGDCVGAGKCPPTAKLGCGCATTSSGSHCVPKCVTSTDCPDPSKTCSTDGFCTGGGGDGGTGDGGGDGGKDGGTKDGATDTGPG